MSIDPTGDPTIEIVLFLPYPTRLLSREHERSTSRSVSPTGRGQLGSRSDPSQRIARYPAGISWAIAGLVLGIAGCAGPQQQVARKEDQPAAGFQVNVAEA